MANLKKKQKVESLINLIKETPNFLIIQLEKITHKKLEEIRRSLSDKNKAKVIKNSLLEKSINKISKNNPIFKDFRKKFFPIKNQNLIVSFKEDWFEALKIIDAFLKKDYPLKFKFGYLDGQIYDDLALKKIASLPPRKILLAQLITNLKNPVNRLHQTINYPLSKLIFVLKNKKINS